MIYEEVSVSKLFLTITTEIQAVEVAWKYKTDKQKYCCPKCFESKYYQHIQRPEIRECPSCEHQHRLRVGTVFQNSKVPMLTWVRAIHLRGLDKH